MLHWLPSVRCKLLSSRKTFFYSIVILVSIAHIALLGGGYLIGLLLYKHDTYAICMHQSGATYVLMPLDKQVKQQQRMNGDSNCKQSKIIDYDSYQKRKKTAKSGSACVTLQKSKQKSVQKKKLQKRSMRCETSLQSKSLVRSKKFKNNKVKMIEQQEVAKKAAQEQSAMQTPTATQESTPVQQPEMSAQDTAQDCLDAIDENNVIFIGYEQLDQSIIASKIQHAIAQSWNPPVGIEPGTSCQVLVDVGSDGCLKSVEIVKSSGKLIYDMCAKTSVDIEYPEQVWNKKFTIVLGN